MASRLLATLTVAALMLGFIAPTGSSAQSPSVQVPAGTLDPTFGNGGKVVTNLGRTSAAAAVVMQPDGKLVVTGNAAQAIDPTADKWKFGLVRYNPDGSLDSSFGDGGTVSTALSDAGSRAADVALQSDGKIVAAGAVFPGQTGTAGFGVVRYNVDGSLDKSFGANGIVIVTVGGREATAVAIQRDGKVVVTGVSDRDQFGTIRLNVDGTEDSAFGTDGAVTTEIGTVGSTAADVAVQADGKIVVVGRKLSGSADSDFAIVRYTSDGRLDASFGNGGIATPAVDSGAANAVAVQDDGKIVAAGPSARATGPGFDITLARFNAQGSLDLTFGNNGTETTDVGGGNALDVALQLDGKIVVAADIQNAFGVIRYTGDGSLDSSFGAGGMVTTAFGEASGAYSVAVQPDGKIVAVGVGLARGFVVARYFGEVHSDAPPTVGAGGPYSGVEGSPVPLNGSVTDPDSPGATHKWSVVPGANADAGSSCSFADPTDLSTNVKCTDDGTFTLTLTADDGVNPPVSDSTTLTAGNANPVVSISSPDAGALVTRGSTETVTAPFTDAGSNDTHTCSVDFDDGTPAVTAVVTEAAGEGVCSASHAIATVGAHRVVVTVTDDDAGMGSAAVSVVSYLRGGAFALQATGPVAIAKTPNVACPPNDAKTTAALRTPVASLQGLTASCALDPGTGTSTASAAVTDVTALGVIHIKGIDSICTASATGTTATSHVGTINGIKIGTRPGTIGIPGVAEVHYNETVTTATGLTHNAIRIHTLVGETITLASCQLG